MDQDERLNDSKLFRDVEKGTTPETKTQPSKIWPELFIILRDCSVKILEKDVHPIATWQNKVLYISGAMPRHIWRFGDSVLVKNDETKEHEVRAEMRPLISKGNVFSTDGWHYFPSSSSRHAKMIPVMRPDTTEIDGMTLALDDANKVLFHQASESNLRIGYNCLNGRDSNLLQAPVISFTCGVSVQ